MRNVLVVSSAELPRSLLETIVSDEDAVRIVVPVVRQSLLDWLANDQRAFSAAQDIAERTAERLPIEPLAAGPGESDLSLAIRDALATFPADEIVVAVGGDISPETIVRRNGGMYSFDGVPVRWIAVADR